MITESHLTDLHSRYLDGLRHVGGQALRRELAGFAHTTAEDLVTPWLVQEEDFAEALYREVASWFVAAANSFLAELDSIADSAVGLLPEAIGTAEGFRTGTPLRY